MPKLVGGILLAAGIVSGIIVIRVAVDIVANR